MAGNPDPLDGYRGRPVADFDELLEEEVRQLHAMEESDLALIRDVIRADQLDAALKQDTVLARVVTFATKRLDECCKIWQNESDPSSVRAMNAHREARAARLLINWIQSEIAQGGNADVVLRMRDQEGLDHE